MDSKDYLEIDFSDITARFPLDRREFLKLFGGGDFCHVLCGKLSVSSGRESKKSPPAAAHRF